MSAGGSLSAAQRLREHSREVIEQLRAGYYLDELYATKVFSEDDRDEVKALEKKRSEQARKFMDIMATKSEDKIRTFYEILRTAPEDKQPHLYKLFFPEAEQHARKRSTGQTGTPGSTTPTMSTPSTHTDPRRAASRSSKEGKSTSTIAAGELDEDAVVTPKQMQRPHIYFEILFPEEKSLSQTGSERPERGHWQRPPASTVGQGMVPRQKLDEVAHKESESDSEEESTMRECEESSTSEDLPPRGTKRRRERTGKPASAVLDGRQDNASKKTKTTGQTKEFRILAVSTGWSSTKGGIQTFNRAMCKALAQDERVKVACMLPEFTKEEYDDAQRSNVQLFLKKDKASTSTLSKLKPNILIGHGIPQLAEQMEFLEELLVAIKIKHKTVLILHVYPFLLEPNKQTEGAASKADAKESELLRQAQTADVVAAVGPRLARYWASRLSKSLVQLNPGLYHDDVQVKNRPQVANQPSRCLFIARLDSDSAQESKGLHVAVEAMKQYNKQLESTDNKAGAVFAVRGFKDSAACDEFIKATQPRLNKILIEPKAFNADEEAVKSEMEAADVFLMPSLEEGFGLTALEALSVGTPVLCSKNSGFAEILEEIRENDKVKGEFISNWIVPPKEKEEFGRQLGTQLWSMLRTSKTREDTYKEAEELQRQWKETYSWSKMVTALLEKLRPSTD